MILNEKRDKKWSNNCLYNEKSHEKLYRLAKTNCWSDDDVENQPNDREIPYKLWGRSTLQYLKGKAPNFDTIALLKGDNGWEEIIICKFINESHTKNIELTTLVPCGDGPILSTASTNDTWTHTMDDVMSVQMVYADESGKLMLHHPSLSETKSQLNSSGTN